MPFHLLCEIVWCLVLYFTVIIKSLKTGLHQSCLFIFSSGMNLIVEKNIIYDRWLEDRSKGKRKVLKTFL